VEERDLPEEEKIFLDEDDTEDRDLEIESDDEIDDSISSDEDYTKYTIDDEGDWSDDEYVEEDEVEEYDYDQYDDDIKKNKSGSDDDEW
jgi:hypothetical protein